MRVLVTSRTRGTLLMMVPLLLLAVGPAVPVAIAFSVAPTVLVSGSNPFASCAVGGPGTDYSDDEVETRVAVNPADPLNIIGVWQQDRWARGGGAHGIVAGRSLDGGNTWSSTFAHFTLCSGGNRQNGGNYERGDDPWVTFAPDGVAYQSALAFNHTTSATGVLVSRSTDGGGTWSEPISLIRDVGSPVINDKQSITADPGNSNLVYVVWSRVQFSHTANGNASGAEMGSFIRGPLMLSRTTNGGLSWGAPKVIFDGGANHLAENGQIVVLPNGNLLCLLTEGLTSLGALKSNQTFDLDVIRSTDKGVTWSRPITVAKVFDPVANQLGVSVTDPDTGQRVRAYNSVAEIGVNPNNSNLFVVWSDGRFSGYSHDDIALSISVDGGSSWSAPVKINKTPVAVSAFTPSVTVAADGTVAATYYDFRNDTPAPGLPTDYWIVHCTSSCSNPASWSENHLAGPFDMEKAPISRGFFVGDYEGLARAGNNFVAFFVMSTNDPSNPTDVFATIAG